MSREGSASEESSKRPDSATKSKVRKKPFLLNNESSDKLFLQSPMLLSILFEMYCQFHALSLGHYQHIGFFMETVTHSLKHR